MEEARTDVVMGVVENRLILVDRQGSTKIILRVVLDWNV